MMEFRLDLICLFLKEHTSSFAPACFTTVDFNFQTFYMIKTRNESIRSEKTS